MADKAVTVRTRKFVNNALLGRRQMTVDVIHPNRPNVPKSELQELIAKKYKVADTNCVSMFGFKTHFGGGKSTGFALIYNSIDDVKKFEPKHRLVRLGLKDKVEKSRKQIKEAKNRGKKTRATGRSQAKQKAKRAAKQ